LSAGGQVEQPSEVNNSTSTEDVAAILPGCTDASELVAFTVFLVCRKTANGKEKKTIDRITTDHSDALGCSFISDFSLIHSLAFEYRLTTIAIGKPMHNIRMLMPIMTDLSGLKKLR